jgi:hypothetical protein
MSSDVVAVSASEPEDGTIGVPRYDTPLNFRPDLEALGIVEIERGVCDDTFENRATLRKALMNWDAVYDANGVPTGHIAARTKEATKERRLLSLAEKRPLLVDGRDNNSDYATGLDLLVDEELCKIVPPWVVGAAKTWQAEQIAGGVPAGSKKAPAALPHRCRQIKTDGIRCMLWSSGRLKDDGLCRIHLRTVRKPGADVERARLKLAQSAPHAVDILEDLMENAQSEPVKLKAATEILDRAGVKGGYEFDINVEVTDARPASQVIAERLAKLADGAAAVQILMNAAEDEIVEGEVVESSTSGVVDGEGSDV